MLRRPPRSTRTDTLFPYTTLFRSNFKMLSAGTAVITGTVTQLPGSVPVTGVSPVSASATLISQAASAFCEREFRAPTAMAVQGPASVLCLGCSVRSEEHTSELQSLMRISYAVFCLKKKNNHSH